MKKQAAVDVARSLVQTVRDVVAAAPLAACPESLIFAETLASALVTATCAAARATRSSGAFTHMIAAEDIADRLRAHGQVMHATGLLSSALLETLGADISRFHTALDWLRLNVDDRLQRVA